MSSTKLPLISAIPESIPTPTDCLEAMPDISAELTPIFIAAEVSVKLKL